MKVKLDPYKITSSLEKKLGKLYFLSPRADHPFLYSSPNILVGGLGRLIAIFSPNAKDLRNLSDLNSKLKIGKLVLPIHCTAPLLSSSV